MALASTTILAIPLKTAAAKILRVSRIASAQSSGDYGVLILEPNQGRIGKSLYAGFRRR